uniref:Uncharacterized protein n=1 Tax=Arundo donax TaxID=35708 RepID=A0A0A9GH74_ARUDO
MMMDGRNIRKNMWLLVLWNNCACLWLVVNTGTELNAFLVTCTNTVH